VYDRHEEGCAKFRIVEGIENTGAKEMNSSPNFRYSNLWEDVEPSHILMFDAMTVHIPV
jgi:hypothetical protein